MSDKASWIEIVSQSLSFQASIRWLAYGTILGSVLGLAAGLAVAL